MKITYKLMIKIHRNTKLKYLCLTSKKNWKTYKGSGVYWKQHLKVHGKNFRTFLILESENIQEITELGLYYSIKYNIVESDNWANLIPETGYGNSVLGSSKKGGKYVYENKLGFFSDAYDESVKKEWHKNAGKIGGRNTKNNLSGIFSPRYNRGEQSRKTYFLGKGLGSIPEEIRLINCRNGGLKTKETKAGIFGATKEQRKLWARENGAKGAKIVTENKLGFLSATGTQKSEWSSVGGKIGGKIVGSMFWWNNGEINKKSFECPGEGWKRGQIESEKKRKSRELNFCINKERGMI